MLLVSYHSQTSKSTCVTCFHRAETQNFKTCVKLTCNLSKADDSDKDRSPQVPPVHSLNWCVHFGVKLCCRPKPAIVRCRNTKLESWRESSLLRTSLNYQNRGGGTFKKRQGSRWYHQIFSIKNLIGGITHFFNRINKFRNK